MSDLAKQREATAGVIEEIAEKRLRQVFKHGFDAGHDDLHDEGELLLAAICYAAPVPVYIRDDYATEIHFKDPWPWAQRFDLRPYAGNAVKDPKRVSQLKRRALLVTAGAWLVAEIERIDRDLAGIAEEKAPA